MLGITFFGNRLENAAHATLFGKCSIFSFCRRAPLWTLLLLLSYVAPEQLFFTPGAPERTPRKVQSAHSPRPSPQYFNFLFRNVPHDFCICVNVVIIAPSVFLSQRGIAFCGTRNTGNRKLLHFHPSPLLIDSLCIRLPNGNPIPLMCNTNVPFDIFESHSRRIVSIFGRITRFGADLQRSQRDYFQWFSYIQQRLRKTGQTPF